MKDVMKIRANIQDIIEDVCKKDGDTDEFCGECGAKMDLKDGETK
jgi:hypothetical protein